MKVIIAVSSKYSGSTLLHRSLAKHPDCAWLSQFSVSGPKLVTEDCGFQAHWDKYARRILPHPISKEDRFSRAKKLLWHLLPVPKDATSLWEHYFPGTIDSAELYNLKHAVPDDHIRQIFAEFLAFHQKTHLMLKRPDLVGAIPLLARIFPEAKFVLITRDPRAQVLSFIKKRGLSLEALPNVATHWKTLLQTFDTCRDIIGKERCMTVRYEDLCLDLHSMLRKIYTFADWTGPFDFVASLPKTFVSSNPQLTASATAETLLHIEQHTAPYLDHCGYREPS